MKAAVLTIASLIFLPAFCLGFEAAALHERADKESLESAQEIVEKSQVSFDGLYTLALIHLNLYNEKEAQALFEKLSGLYPDRVEPKWGLSEILRRKHEFAKSESLLNEIIKHQPDFSPAFISLAYIKFTKLDFKKSLELAYVVIRQGRQNVDLSNYARAYLLVAGSRGMLAHYGGPFSKLIDGNAVMPNLKKARQLRPDSAGVLFGFGTFYLLAPSIIGGDKNKALDYLNAAVKKDPHFADAYVRLAQAYLAIGNKAKYDLFLEKALSIDPLNELALDIKNGRCRFVCDRESD